MFVVKTMFSVHVHKQQKNDLTYLIFQKGKEKKNVENIEHFEIYNLYIYVLCQ
jgi:hypothetical protein